MSEVFISYARSTEREATQIGDALRALGYGVWRDDELPAHRSFAEVIEERLKASKAVVVVWSGDAAKSEWVQSEADRARADHKLVQLTLDGAPLPMPFDRIQCADLMGWSGDLDAPGWKKVVASVAELAGNRAPVAPPAVAAAPLPSLRSARSIAVAPFANLSRKPEQDALVDGIVREIASELTRHRELFVIAPGSISALKDKALGPQEIARQFGVRYVLEGSVRASGERVRIAVSLIDGADDAQVWADRFDDTLQDVFELQDRIALEVVGRISSEITRAEIRKAFAGRAANPTDDLVLRAYAEYFTFQGTGIRRAVELLDKAIALDPRYAMALATCANARASLVANGWSDDPDADRRIAMELGERATDAEPDNARVLAHVCLSLGQLHEDRARVEALAKRALAISPGDPLVWALSGILRVILGELDQAEAHLLQALRLAPNDTITEPRGALATCRLLQRRFEEALELVHAHSRPLPINIATAASVYGHLGMATESRGALARFRAASPLTFESFAAWHFERPEHRALILEGIGRAEALAQEASRD